MPQDPKKRQKAIMKKRRKDKIRHQKKAVVPAIKNKALIENARKHPLYECYINANWEQADSTGVARLLITRQLPDEGLILGNYLVDMYCLGLKDTFARTNLLPGEYRDFMQAFYWDTTPLLISPELAHQIIYEAIDYAAQFDFKPHKDFKLTQNILEKRETLEKPHQLTFGKNGKPFYIEGPHDNTTAILAKLNKKPGPGNYEFMSADTLDDDDFFDDDYMEDDEE